MTITHPANYRPERVINISLFTNLSKTKFKTSTASYPFKIPLSGTYLTELVTFSKTVLKNIITTIEKLSEMLMEDLNIVLRMRQNIVF